MYTLEQLQQKTFGELKAIGWQLNVLPAGDRRCRQSWIDAIAGMNPPLLELLEYSPTASVEQVQEPIAQAAETSPGVEVEPVQDMINQTWTSWEKEHCAWLKNAKWCIHHGENKRIDAFLPVSKTLRLEGMKKGTEYCAIWEVSECTYDFSGLPLPVCSSLYAQEPIAQNEEAIPQFGRGESANVHNRRSHPTKSDRDSSGAETEALGSEEGDRVLAVARDCETDRGRVLPDQSIELVKVNQSIELVNLTEAERLENEPRMSQSAIVQAAKTSPAAPQFQVGDLVQSKTMLWGIEKLMMGNVLELLPRGGVRVQFGDHISGYGGTFDFSKSQLEDLIPVQEPIKPIDDFVNTSQRQGPIAQAVKTSDAKVSFSKKVKASSYLDCPNCGPGRLLRVTKSIYWETSCTKCDYFTQSILYPFTPAVTGYKVGDWVKLRIKPRLATNIRRGEVVCIDKVQDDSLRFVNPNLNPALVIWARREFLYPHEVFPCESPVVKAAETSPGVEVTYSDRKRYWADRGFFLIPEAPAVPEENSAVEFDGCIYCTSPEYESLRNETYRCYRCEPEPDQNPILTGIVLSDRFLARYSPPQSETLHYEIADGSKVDTDGQLSLFEAQVVTEPEPPDPDDFESIDAFREAIARWDWEHPSSFDHCSDYLPSSVHCEPPDPEDFDSMFAFWAAYDAWDEASDNDSEPLEISLDSFCEWAHCPAYWYEPAALLDLSKVSEVSEQSPTCKSSITSDFFIPTFGCWGDRSNRNDEPPDTGFFARLPKPKPPTFPPQASQPRVHDASRNYPETIPKLFHRVAAGSSTQPARSPPGGDAMS
jgi:hypothetical protein